MSACLPARLPAHSVLRRALVQAKPVISKAFVFFSIQSVRFDGRKIPKQIQISVQKIELGLKDEGNLCSQQFIEVGKFNLKGYMRLPFPR